MLGAVARLGIIPRVSGVLRSCRAIYSWEFSRNLSPRTVDVAPESSRRPSCMGCRVDASRGNVETGSNVRHRDGVVERNDHSLGAPKKLRQRCRRSECVSSSKLTEEEVNSLLDLDVEVDWYRQSGNSEPLVARVNRAIDWRL